MQKILTAALVVLLAPLAAHAQPADVHLGPPVLTDPRANGAVPEELPLGADPAITPLRPSDGPAEPGDDLSLPGELPAIAEPTTLVHPSPAHEAPADPIGMSESPVPIDPATFNGVQPGKSNLADVKQGFGVPRQMVETEDGVRCLFAFAPFKRVEIALVNDVVTSIMIQLEQPLAHDALVEQLQLKDVRPTLVRDDAGQPIGYSFPERGVLFASAQAADSVSHILLEPIDAIPFLVRAESLQWTHEGQAVSDARHAVSLAGDNPRCHDLLARLLLRTGRTDEALSVVAVARQLAPDNAGYRLTQAQAQFEAGRHDEAKRQLDELLAADSVSDPQRAQAECLLGDLAAAAATPDYQKAAEHHQAAIGHAKKSLESAQTPERLAAKQAALDAHLAMAHDIAWGAWQRKDVAVPRWLERAAQLADDLIDHEGVDASLRLRVDRSALEALAGAEQYAAGKAYRESTERLARDLLETTEDELHRQRLHWEAGLSLAAAAEMEFLAKQSKSALHYARLAAEHLEQGGMNRQVPADAHRVGQLCYRLGLLEALEGGNHQVAVDWFDKAAPLLELETPGNVFTHTGRHGEALVSMAISYWHLGDRERAVALTDRGAAIMQEAVEREQLERRCLTVPYQNLAQMHKTLGHTDEAAQFAKRAAAYEEDVQHASFEEK